MKKVLVIGDANSIFIKQYVENVLCKNGVDVVLIRESFINNGYIEEYKKLGVKIESRDVGFISKIPLLRTWLGAKIWCRKMHKKYGKFDVVHVHGLNRFRGSVGNAMHSYSNQYAISVWGDEILRGDDKRKNSFRKFYDKADVITMATSHVYSQFQKAYANDYKDKIKICRFGLSVLDKIDEVAEKYSREQLCDEFGISNKHKINVLVGYNGREQQNLIELTKVLQTLSPENTSKVVAVYTFAYGKRSEEYNKALHDEISKLKCEVVILSEFMSEEKMAKLRCISDIILHAQPTDAFSASIQECLYSGTIVFNGAWLKYNELDEINAKLITFENYEQLSLLLPEYIENFQEKKLEFATNKNALRSLSSQEVTEKIWLDAILNNINFNKGVK